ncbi:response regulator [Methylopila sp. M107]|uniref:response regulator n=1 Tax=Methylopila sp. M107 TaxID=1101190 RepID=UPI0003680468|nr:response regulator [Methylopila sp. M107]
MAIEASPFSGRRVLVVEDDFLLALDVSQMLEVAGATVIGPTSTVKAGLAELEREAPDIAVLDINLGDGTSFPLVDVLQERGLPVILATGYDLSAIPDRYRALPCCQKPIGLRDLEQAMTRS